MPGIRWRQRLICRSTAGRESSHRLKGRTRFNAAYPFRQETNVRWQCLLNARDHRLVAEAVMRILEAEGDAAVTATTSWRNGDEFLVIGSNNESLARWSI